MSDIDLDSHIDSATKALLARQHADGHFQFELEADATVPAEYVLFRHYLGEPVDAALEASIAGYLRRIQGPHGGWPLFADGAFDMSATVKAYFALKMIGDSPQAEHMRRAREAVRLRGGAERSNVFTRCLLALHGIIPWRAVPVMPVEIMLLPKWFPFHLDKISYWSRTVIVPLLVLMARKPHARNPKEVSVAELFLEPPRQLGPTPKAPQQKASWFWYFRVVDDVLRAAEPWFPKKPRLRAVDRAITWVSERLNGEDGLGAIFPAMANSVMMFAVLGYPQDHPQRAIARRSVEKLLAVHEHEAYCQPCVSPIWDTGLTCHALLEAGGERAVTRVKRALDWLSSKQILDVRGDWIARRPDIRPGGWAFQYANPHYPDVDDTAVVAMAMDREQNLSARKHYDPALARAREWIVGMQRRSGARRRLLAAHAACRGQLVRPLGHELHLRHLVGAVRAQCRRRRSRRAGNAQGGELADQNSERGRRMGRGRLKLQARLPRQRARAVDRFANRLGAARPYGRGRDRSSGGRARHQISRRHARP